MQIAELKKKRPLLLSSVLQLHFEFGLGLPSLVLHSAFFVLRLQKTAVLSFVEEERLYKGKKRKLLCLRSSFSCWRSCLCSFFFLCNNNFFLSCSRSNFF